MKKFLLVSIAIFASMCLMAQQSKLVYCELVGSKNEFTGKVTVSVDFGQSGQQWHNQTLVDENGKPIKFNSMIDAMNWMGEKGWKFEQAYTIGMGGGLVYHWLLSKEILEDATISNDFKTRTQYKQEQ